jgi:predicted PurR-regulated permease PerM
MLVPEISATINTIGDKFPDSMNSIKNWAIKITADYPEIVNKITNIDIDWENATADIIDIIRNGSGSLLSSTFSFATSVVSGVIDFVVGLFFAIYILAQKENLERQSKGLAYAILKEKTADRIIKTCAMADQTFSNFITGQCLEACILGFMFFVSMHILSIPFALTISVTIAVTALIPVFGSFVGCAVGAFLILVDDPKKVIVFLILFVVLQQIEGNLIYPHVVGGSVGLPSIWVLVAVSLGGSLMGILGMLVFVPLFSVIYALVKEFVIVRLKEKHISRDKYEMRT